jgi:vacuolar-type H+-ATPase subunit H
MARQLEEQHSDPAVAAIERVLKVERDGAEKLQRGQKHAKQLVSEARDHAAAIGRRADARISKLHNAYLQKVQRDIEQLAQSNPTSGEHSGTYDQAALTEAARRVAAKLTGGA